MLKEKPRLVIKCKKDSIGFKKDQYYPIHFEPIFPPLEEEKDGVEKRDTTMTPEKPTGFIITVKGDNDTFVDLNEDIMNEYFYKKISIKNLPEGFTVTTLK